MNHSVAALIPAAGLSGRMGIPKALLRHGCGSSFARYMLNCYGIFGCDPVVLVINHQLSDTEITSGKHLTILNPNPQWGRTHSIRLGLKAIPPATPCFVHNVDNPYLTPEMLDAMLALVTPKDYVVPVFKGKGGHPVLLGATVADAIRDCAEPSDFRSLLSSWPRKEVGWNDDRILLNINTPDDYRQMI